MKTPQRTHPAGSTATSVDGEMIQPSSRLFPSWLAIAAALSAASLPVSAQVAAAPAPAKPIPTTPTPVETRSASRPPDASEDNMVTLETFQVNAEKDNGFMATNAGTATKLGLDMKDMSAPYSVMTGEFIKAMGLPDIQSAVMWSTNGSAVLDGQGADLFGGGGTSTASTMYNIRGVILNAGQQRNFFITAGLEDTYNVERIDFGRGPNAVLFNVGANDALGGSISTQGKRPHVDRNSNEVAVTVGSWDYYRSTLDVNRTLIDGKLAVRVNALYQKKKGWMDQEFDDRKGVTLSALYKLGPKTEVQLELISDETRRARVPLPYFDNISGWNGKTVFSGPVTLDQINGLAPLGDGTYLKRGATSPTNSTIVPWNGEAEGVWREGGDVFIYDPASNSVMNWINTGSTRRGDETSRTPIYLNGVAWSRGGNDLLLPLGNGGGSGGNTRTPSPTASNGGAAPFYDAINLPADRFSTQIAGSHFTLPSKRFSAMPREPLFIQPTKDINFAIRHQATDSLYLEFAADFNRVKEIAPASYLNFRTAFIDINKLLPNGTANPHFLDAYSQSDTTKNFRTLDNYGVKATAAYIKNLGKWGDYTFNVSLSASGREVYYLQKALSVAIATDPRQWQAGAQRLRERYYWNDDVRPFSDVAPTSLFQRVVNTGGNSYTTSTQNIAPRWVLTDWSDRKESIRGGIFAFAARYFDNKLIISPGIRVDQQRAYLRQRPTNYGFLPNDLAWDGAKLDDRYWRPDAPKDWFTMTYVPKNADGTPRASQPALANINRPTIGGVNGVDTPAPQYAGDRFRGDYNNPRLKQNVVLKNVGVTYHALSWVTAKANYSEGYKPGDTARYLFDGSEAKPETGKAYEAGLTFSFFGDKLDITPRYYFDRKENRLGDPPTTSPMNDLMKRNAWNDGSPDGRNNLGYGDVIGGDYFATKNNGTELEINGRITRGWRVLANYGTGKLVDYDRWKNARAYVQGRKNEMLDALKAAGGTLDPAQKPTNAGHSVTDAPGLAIADPAITDAMINAAGGNTGERVGAINNYNNIWVQYDNIALLQETTTIKRKSMKIYTDYTVQSGRFRSARLGLGWQYVDKDLAGYRSGDTVANPSFNAALPVSATNLPYMDDPSVDVNTPIFVKRPSEVMASIGYTKRLKAGRSLDFQLTIRNLLNKTEVFYQDDGVTLRPPNGDTSAVNRVAVPGRVALYERPINFEFTTRLSF